MEINVSEHSAVGFVDRVAVANDALLPAGTEASGLDVEGLQTRRQEPVTRKQRRLAEAAAFTDGLSVGFVTEVKK